MDNDQKFKKWNARWMIVAGRAVCTGCLENQALEDCEAQFPHAHSCELGDGEFERPWVALHAILDCARG